MKITNIIEIVFSFIEKLWLNVKKIEKAINALIVLDLSPVKSIDKRKIIEIIIMKYLIFADLNL